MERIKFDSVSPIFSELISKLQDSEVTKFPAGYQSSCFTYAYSFDYPGFYVINGLSRVDDSVIVESGVEEVVVIADVKNRVLLKVNDVDLSEVKHNQILDLNVEGDRWEGDVLNKKPCGWGVLYNKDNHRVYEGFRVYRVNVCYGRKYYSDIEKIKYEGEICDGMRWGRGVQYDRNGDVVYDGEWLNDGHLRVVITPENEVFYNRIEELVVSDYCCSGEDWLLMDLDFRIMESLKSLIVGDECFDNIHKLKWIGMNELEKVEIGRNSFTKSKDSYDDASYRHFYLKNCPKLKSLKIGCYSFSDYTVCEIENVDALEEIEIGCIGEGGSANFYYAPLELKSRWFFPVSND